MRPHERIKAFARPSYRCDGRDVDAAHKLCEVIKDWLRVTINLFVLAKREEPMLIQHGADGAPIRTKDRYSVRWNGLNIVRAGRSASEWIVSRMFLHCDGVTRVMFTEPRRMATKLLGHTGPRGAR